MIVENSHVVLGDDRGDYGKIIEVLGVRGFRVRPVLVCAIQYALPASRRRSYLVYTLVHTPLYRIICWQSFIVLIDRNLDCLMRDGPDLLDVLFPPQHPAVLETREACQKHSAHGLAQSTVDGHAGAVKTKFGSSSLTVRLGTLRCRDTSLASPWFGPLNHRDRQILAMLPAADSEDPSMKIYDVSQTSHRCPSSSICPIKGVMQAPTVLPGSFCLGLLPRPGRRGRVEAQHSPQIEGRAIAFARREDDDDDVGLACVPGKMSS